MLSDRDWLKQFFEYLTGERACSEHTVSAYRTDVDKFRGSLAGKDLLAGTSDDIRGFVAGELDAGASPQSAARRLAAIKAFYQFVFMEGGLRRSPARNVRAPKVPRQTVRPTSGKEVDEMLAALGATTALQVRDRAFMYVAYGSGLRASELVNLRISDLDLQHGVAKVRLGKGQKDRLVPLNPREIEAIRIYLEVGRPQLSPEPGHDLLFVGRYGQALTRQRLWQVLTTISLRLLGRRVSPHKFRHAFVTDTVHGGADIRVVQRMAGHADVNTTMRYMHSDLERLRAQYLKFHPRGAEPCERPSSDS